MNQDKAQPAVNGYSLNKGCNAVLGYLWASLRARRALQLTASRLADTYTLFVTPH